MAPAPNKTTTVSGGGRDPVMAQAIRDEACPSVEPTTPFRLVAVTSNARLSVGRCNECPLALLGPLSGVKIRTNRKEMIP